MGLMPGIDPNLVTILKKLATRGNHIMQLTNSIQEKIGISLTMADYFLSGTTEPQKFSDENSITENLLGLKNSILKNRRLVDSLNFKVTTDSTKIHNLLSSLKTALNSCQRSIKDIKSKPSNANPNAELENIRKQVAENLAKNSSLSAGNALNAIDITARMVEIENNQKRLTSRLDMLGKRSSVKKIGNQEEIMQDLERMKERLDSLEDAQSAPHSENLFADTIDSRIDLVQRDIMELQQNQKLNLASSEVNKWLNAKLDAFLGSPNFQDALRNDFNNRSQIWVLKPGNLSSEVREAIVKVSTLNDIIWNRINLYFLGRGTGNSQSSIYGI